MIVSTLIYIRKNGKTLMLRRDKKDKIKHNYRYNGVGGKLEKAETPERCAIREIKEETGLTANKLNYRGHITFPNFTKDVDWLVFVYECFDFTGDIIESEEGSLHWIDDENILSLNIYEGDFAFLEILYGSTDLFYGESYYIDEKYSSSKFNRIKINES